MMIPHYRQTHVLNFVLRNDMTDAIPRKPLPAVGYAAIFTLAPGRTVIPCP
jgi:hypothetical protein